MFENGYIPASHSSEVNFTRNYTLLYLFFTCVVAKHLNALLIVYDYLWQKAGKICGCTLFILHHRKMYIMNLNDKLCFAMHTYITTVQQPFMQDNQGEPAPELSETLILRTGKPPWRGTRHPGLLSLSLPSVQAGMSTHLAKARGVNRHVA